MNDPLPAAEQDRLDALAAYGVLDTPAEAEFDRITQLAAHLFKAPIALISLVDEHRQWFKAARGLDACSTPRGQAFCAHALSLPPGSVLVVEDAARDPRFADNPLVVGAPGIRFYAGALLTGAGGHALGALCVIDTAPRPRPTEDELVQLRTLADMVVDHLEARRARVALQAQAEIIAGNARQLRALNGRLEEGIAERTDLLERERARLAASEARLKGLIANAHEAIVVADEAGRIEDWNREAELVFGWRACEAIGRTMSELLIPPGLRAAHEAGLKRLVAHGEGEVASQRIETPALRRDGAQITVEMALSATRGDGGWRFTALLHDVSARVEQTQLFENAFHHAPIGFALVDLDGGFTKINSAFAELVGYGVDELLAISFQAITHPDDLDRDLQLLDRLVAGAIPNYQMDKRYLRRDGRVVWVSLSVSLIRRRDGSPKHFIAQVQELTERMEAEARYRLMAENARDMIVTCDREGRATFISASCKAITGWTPAEALGKPADEYVHPNDLELVRAAFRRAAEGGAVQRIRWRGWNQARRGWMWLESSPSLLTDGDELCLVDVVRDVDAQVALEAELRAAKAAAETAAEVKAQFLANMSHELRTPLTSIIGFADLAAKLEDLPGRARDYVGRIQTASQALLSLVNDVLDFSKLEADEVALSPRPVDIAALCHRVADMFGAQVDAKDLTLGRALDALDGRVLMLDPDRVRQVMINLMSNAVKFTKAGGLELRGELDGARGRLRISVRDTGPGVPPDKLDRLFRRFSQIDGSNTRAFGGTSLGLAICKALIERMGGEIGVDSREGEGSTFWFDIPAEAAAAPAPPSTEIGGVPLPGVRVLVVDDHAGNRDLAQLFLEGAGAEVDTAPGGAEAVASAGAKPFDVILMDVRMPGMDGPSALAAIRADPGPNDAAPILAFTANAEAGEVVRLLALGFHGVIPKPITPHVLLQAVAAAVGELLAADLSPEDLPHVA